MRHCVDLEYKFILEITKKILTSQNEIYNINEGDSSCTRRAKRNTQNDLQCQVAGAIKKNSAMKKTEVIITLHHNTHTW